VAATAARLLLALFRHSAVVAVEVVVAVRQVVVLVAAARVLLSREVLAKQNKATREAKVTKRSISRARLVVVVERHKQGPMVSLDPLVTAAMVATV